MSDRHPEDYCWPWPNRNQFVMCGILMLRAWAVCTVGMHTVRCSPYMLGMDSRVWGGHAYVGAVLTAHVLVTAYGVRVWGGLGCRCGGGWAGGQYE